MERKIPSMERLQARTFKSTSKEDLGTKEKQKNKKQIANVEINAITLI